MVITGSRNIIMINKMICCIDPNSRVYGQKKSIFNILRNRAHGAREPGNQINSEPGNQGTREPGNQGTRNQGTREPGNQGPGTRDQGANQGSRIRDFKNI
jgi:hypothetical protein